MKVVLQCIVLCAISIIEPCLAGDQTGSKDHPVISRFPNSVIFRQLNSDFDEYSISLTAPTLDEASFVQVKNRIVEGRVSRTSYEMPSNASLLAIYRSFEQALIKGGFQIEFSCKKEACGKPKYWMPLHLGVASGFASHQYYLVAKRKSAVDNIYVVLHASQNGDGGFIYTQVDVVEEKLLEQDLISTSVAGLTSALAGTGKALIYDIYFDSGKSEIKPESRNAIQALVSFLKSSADKFVVVGHTDWEGALTVNSELSKRRADAVVSALIGKGIGKERLTAFGVGFLSPVASNETDAGREKNRRVELVVMRQ